uniref:hypothetical protein n=1 Tax=Inonotus hispidus TaxID=40469 RepID=UPI0021820C4B|nr:hypothetical protein N4M07_mgp037 [Inonotus hispidus]UVF38015.1 hypothetical protein [Inonotus hispidus]
MKILIEKIQKYLKSLTTITEDIHSTYFHLNNFNEYDFPFKIIFKFLNNIDYIDEEREYILLKVKVNSCDYKIIAGNKHDYAFYETINTNNNFFVINNIPVDLFDDKNNVDLTCYLSKLIYDYCIKIDTIKYGTSVDLFFEYKYISYENYLSYSQNRDNK